MTQVHSDVSIMPQVIISAQQLTQKIKLPQKELTIFSDLSLSIVAGEQVAITGRSGSGKSTLLGILATLDQASGGELIVCGESISKLNEEQRAQVRLKHIGFVFQSFQLLPRLNAIQNVELPMIYAGIEPQERRTRAIALLERVGLGARMGHRPNQLSGGQQQRVAIARSLANQPDLLLADEPTGALDSATGVEVLSLFQKLNADGLTVVLVTHDRGVADAARRRIAFRDGRVTEDARS